VFDHVEVTPGSPALASSARGFLTRGGTFVAADVSQVDDSFVHYHRNNKAHTIPAKDVSRVLFKPLLAEHAEMLAEGRTGALMSNGDFVQGEVRAVKEGQAEVSSVLFGLRRMPVNEDLVAVVMNELAPVKAAFELVARDGSVYRSASVREEKGEVVLEDGSVGRVKLPAQAVTEIRALAPSPAGDR